MYHMQISQQETGGEMLTSYDATTTNSNILEESEYNPELPKAPVLSHPGEQDGFKAALLLLRVLIQHLPCRDPKMFQKH